MEGLGLGVMKNNSDSETPPPGDGLKTVTSAFPTATMSLAGMYALKSVELS